MSVEQLERIDHGDDSDTITPDRIESWIHHAAHLLPAQGPITAFVHHNTLHAFEEFEFDQAVRRGAKIFGCHPYLPETEYRKLLSAGRIELNDLEAALDDVLQERADDLVGFLGTRLYLDRALLLCPTREGTSRDLEWELFESDALERFRPDVSLENQRRLVESTRRWVTQTLLPSLSSTRNESDQNIPCCASNPELAQTIMGIVREFSTAPVERWTDRQWESLTVQLLWPLCQAGAARVRTYANAESDRFKRPQTRLYDLTGTDPDEWVDNRMIPFCAAFLDQGFSGWALPDRDAGFYASFVKLYSRPAFHMPEWLQSACREFRELSDHGVKPTDSIEKSLADLGYTASTAEEFITSELLAMRGFAGMIWQLETRGDRVSHPVAAGSLLEYLAVRLVLTRHAMRHVASRQLRHRGTLAELVTKLAKADGFAGASPDIGRQRLAFRIFEIAQLLGWSPQLLGRLTDAEWRTLGEAIADFDGTTRRQVFHLAYERRYRHQTLDAVAVHSSRVRELTPRHDAVPASDTTPLFQVVCCIDDREESLRRHLEEIEPQCETLGAAGFFGIAMYYRGAADAHYTPLCPVSIRPRHYVREEVVYSLQRREARRSRARRTIGTVTHRVHIGSRTFTGGWIGTTLFGSLATFPLVARILFPRITAQLRSMVGGFVRPPETTRLILERFADEPGPEGDHIGFTVPEMADIVQRLIEDIGIQNRMSRLVFIVGHGSSSLNNPHEAAHDCGACGGGRGGPNARAFAQMANDPRVRQILADRGLEIPSTTIFVGCYHNTCDDSVTAYDLDFIPVTHRREFERAMASMDRARTWDAHERCRRFESAPLELTPEQALRHVEGRAEDLSQVRPEYGHATNALCFVGQRQWNRDLFCDRRVFLQSYDPQLDDERHSVLTRILQAVIPVCAGINLEYYFSFVDPTGYGCGTKLPHNITSLLGVMNGAASDLRPGLPWQMVEIHEPVRLLFVIETTPDVMLQIIDENPPIARLCRGHWVQLATLDPSTSQIQLYDGQQFHPYDPESRRLAVARTSGEWYRGWRDHLPFASIGEPYLRFDPAKS